jgi:homoaconitate hydratase
MGQTIAEKIVQGHMTDGPRGRAVAAGDFVAVRPRHVMTHDNTAAVMGKFRAIGASRIHDTDQPVFALDHDIQNLSEANIAKYKAIEAFAGEQGIRFYPAGSGIGHQLMVERGHVLPGDLVVGSDSHSNMYGAVGALGTPVVRTDAAAIWATGEFWWQVPRTVQVVLSGELSRGATGKDVIITLCGLYNQGEVLNAAVEFNGDGVATLPIEARMTISNMTTEWGALTGWFPADAETFSYLDRRRERLGRLGAPLDALEELERARAAPPAPDTDARYAARIELDLGKVTPHVSGPDTVQTMTSLAELAERRVRVSKAYIISCVNSRESDLAAAAAVLEGQRVAPDVELYVAAASREVQERAEESGVWQTFADAGAHFLPPGCGPCIGLGAGLLEAGEVGISATNRNFKGRMGSREAQCYLASPEVVAASAVAGEIAGPGSVPSGAPARRWTELGAEAPDDDEGPAEILEGFPEAIEGRLVLVPQDNLNTDGIYAKDYTYREDVTEELMASVVMENYDPEFAKRAAAGDVLVGGWNFGTGSSREQAVTALQAKGIRMVLAGSLSQTYLRNAFNNGFLCLAQPDFVGFVREELSSEQSEGALTVVPGDAVTVDFAAQEIRYRGRTFRLPALGTVPQALIVAGGIENQVRARLGLS